MNRIKLTWSRIWDIVRAHFWEVGIGKNSELAMYAIDQLK
jgi:brefeldin A-inhibited guanine nucleotide-exchange protein